MKRLFIAVISPLVLILAGCGTQNSSYKTGVAGNVLTYREFTNLMHNQQNTLNSCFNAAGQSRVAGELALCAVLAASTNAQQTLAGQPAPIRVAKSPEEIWESIATKGLDATVKVFGLKAVRDAVVANSNALAESAAAGSAAQADVARAGIEAAAKDPLVVRPEIVQPTVIHSPAP